MTAEHHHAVWHLRFADGAGAHFIRMLNELGGFIVNVQLFTGERFDVSLRPGGQVVTHHQDIPYLRGTYSDGPNHGRELRHDELPLSMIRSVYFY